MTHNCVGRNNFIQVQRKTGPIYQDHRIDIANKITRNIILPVVDILFINSLVIDFCRGLCESGFKP
jgi:hypothetical protein